MAKSRWPAVVGLVAVVALVGGTFWLRHSSHPVGEAKAATGPKRAGVAVETAAAAVDTVVEDIRAFGTLVANESVVVSPEIPGRVARINFQEAERVEAGQVLVELDAEILKAELARAQSDLALARANSERASTLARQGTGTLRARDEASAAYQAAQANLVLAEARLSKSVITAPFAGVVGFRAISVGAYVSPGDRIVELASIDPLKVEFRVSEVFLPHLKVGLPVRMTVDARPGESIDGEIVAVDPIVDVNGRAVRLRAHVRNPEGRLLPGMFARIRIVVEERPQAVLVPEAAVFRADGGLFVYRVDGGKAVRTAVAIGRRLPGRVEVLDGIDRDTVVVTAGHQRLRDGSKVVVVSGPGAAGAGDS
ncbi:efflux RND transporter periplasmic adaptor subunit [Thalassobaculum fulvum]|uniref:efflux RND transporter periplasmic adaptor subunit n=1 Tax=Thalassobaculum fulvum TaxID=1633335 RepID=UPI001672E580|nr:efflux RND transporter periplasmic adaptor subunit [Thalassobaculum fulvum]